MRKINIVVLGILFFLNPFFLLAKNCYVDSTGQENGSYKTINEALNSNCQSVNIGIGEYVEDVVVNNGVKLTGSGNKTVIQGFIKMNGASGLKDLRVIAPSALTPEGRTVGIKVVEGAKVVIYGVEVFGAGIGIESSDNSELTVIESVTVNNEKGFYIKYGTIVDIRNSEVINNSEEGIDIRANVQGKISGNKIANNGESGIEVVLGGSKIKISNNVILYNDASGIALQFYKDNGELGDFLIAGNELVGNDDYGISCKRPSGGKTVRQYWAKSIKFERNKIEGNKDGQFHSGCKFHGSKKWEATRTKEAQKELNKVLEEIKATYKKMSEKEMVVIVNERMGSDSELDQEKGWWQEEIDGKKRKEIDKIVDDVEWNYNEIKDKNAKLLENTSKIKEFFLGPHKKVLEDLKGDLDSHSFAIKKTKKIVNKIEIEYIKADALQQVEKIEKRKELQEMYDEYSGKFGIWPWVRNLF